MPRFPIQRRTVGRAGTRTSCNDRKFDTRLHQFPRNISPFSLSNLDAHAAAPPEGTVVQYRPRQNSRMGDLRSAVHMRARRMHAMRAAARLISTSRLDVRARTRSLGPVFRSLPIATPQSTSLCVPTLSNFQRTHRPTPILPSSKSIGTERRRHHPCVSILDGHRIPHGRSLRASKSPSHLRRHAHCAPVAFSKL